MLQNAYFLAKIGADTAENEQHFAENEQHFSSSAPSKATVPLSFLVYADGSAVCTSSTFAAANTSGLRARRSVITPATAVSDSYPYTLKISHKYM